ncbi:MAG: HAMP domain-containing histidine kinase [Firmicutes bacterium]|nr:HAMP domain-containing histidine kinase [Bacillota bacterium]
MNNNKLLSSIPLKVLVFLASLVPAVIGVDRFFHIVLEQSSDQVTNWYLQIAACIAAYAVCLVYLLWSSGHRAPDGEVKPGWDTKVPFDLVLLIGFGAGAALCAMWWEFFDHGSWWMAESHPQEYWHMFYPVYGVGAACLAILHGVLMSFALRIKLGGWWKNTIIFQLLLLAWRILKWLWNVVILGIFRWAGRALKCFGRFVADIPLIWKGFLAVGGICLIEFISYLAIYDHGERLIFWFVEHLILVPLVLWGLMQMRKLQKGAHALAEGDLTYKIDTSRMVWDFKKHGEDLNSLAAGSAAAVEQRLKSERFKTELITNVSHDIKTPLTSIINYSDLIAKEEGGNEKVAEYAEVLQRQSEKLKRLLEDLIEASKASTGNLDVNLETCNACTIVSQAEGEYQEKLDAAGLTLVTRMPEEPLYILADGRRIWRVFDNLMNNVCKYSQAGTRVYLTLEKQGTDAVFTLRNTSRDALNISPEELMERFVRGDGSRSTEGSGLGLSIAKSFTELQKGTMDIGIDGDLFKVTLRFAAL